MKYLVRKILSTSLLAVMWIPLHSQFNTDTYSPQATKAKSYFNSKDYLHAINEFKKLHEKYPKDPLYEYYLGISMVEYNTDLNIAIELLKSASTKNVPVEIYFYLGLASYRLFQFDKALEAFTYYKQNASWQEKRKQDIKEQIEKVRQARSFFENSVETEVIKVEKIKKPELYKTLMNLKLVEYSPKSLKNIVDTQMFYCDSNTVVFVPDKISMNTYVYFTTKEKKGIKDGKIVKVLYGDPDNKVKPEILSKTINSFEDKAFPFFNYKDSFLYFSSKGQNSVGEYDIFKSKYNNRTQKWSQPEQLPFPFNSQYNDYLIAIDDNQIILASDRETNSSELSIYYIKYQPIVKKIKLEGPLEMQQAMNLEQLTKVKIEDQKVDKIQEIQAMPLSQNKNGISVVYPKEISKALEIQKQADSAYLCVISCKTKLAQTNDTKDRALIFSEIARNEKIVVKFQTAADSFYKKINHTEDSLNTKDISLLKNNMTNEQAEKENSFAISDHSIYSANNPFPMDTIIPEGLVYRIQLGAFRKPLPLDYFGGINPITCENLQGGKIIKYYAGLFHNFSLADESLKKIQESGFKDAFVVAYINGKKIPLERAKEIEK